jgi:7-carboxy-7-deazaguanine synthase
MSGKQKPIKYHMSRKNNKNNKQQLRINEIFYSIQGESSNAGLPCVFVRLTYCNLRCTYCDTEYAFFEGTDIEIPKILEEIASYQCKLVEITGGEPLIQKNVHPLMRTLCDAGYQVLLETAGHMDITPVDQRVKIIMDIKCPSSGESEKVRWSNINLLKPNDEVKFVIGDRIDFDWACRIIDEYQLSDKYHILFSPVFDKMRNEELANWILKRNLSVRMQLQLHKYIWSPEKRGV